MNLTWIFFEKLDVYLFGMSWPRGFFSVSCTIQLSFFVAVCCFVPNKHDYDCGIYFSKLYLKVLFWVHFRKKKILCKNIIHCFVKTKLFALLVQGLCFSEVVAINLRNLLPSSMEMFCTQHCAFLQCETKVVVWKSLPNATHFARQHDNILKFWLCFRYLSSILFYSDWF